MINNPFDTCPRCGRYWSVCQCYGSKKDNEYIEYMRKLQGIHPAPAIDYDILAEKVAAKVVALLGKKKKRRAAR